MYLLLKGGADLILGGSSITDAVDVNLTDGISKLLRMVSKVDAPSSDRYVKLLWDTLNACSQNGVQSLLNSGVDINAADNGGGTVLMRAANAGHDLLVDALIKAGAYCGATNHSGHNSMFKASIAGHADLVSTFLQAGLCVDARDKGGNTPLICATRVGHGIVVKKLQQAMADVNS